ncbi:MAG: PAS domain S-box protein, partial [Hyphomicrobiaceae bacterium]
MPQLVCLINGEGRLLHVNRTMEWWGLGSVASAKGRQLHDILHRDCTDPDCYFQRFWNESTPSRMAGRRAAREVFDPVLNRHFSLRIQPLIGRRPDLAGTDEDLHTVVVIDDISDLKQAEAKIQRRNKELAQQVAHEVERRELSEEMQARLLTILEKTTDYVAMVDVSESMLYLNPAGRAMLGLEHADDISQKKLCDHADDDVRQNIRDIALPTAIENGLWQGESRMRDSAGREIHTSQVIIAHRGADGLVDCFSTILRDISNRVQTERALRESQEKLRQVSGLLVSIQEDERRRIALDLHDGLGQSISLIKFSVEKVAEQIGAGETAAALDSLRQIIPRLKEALHDVRRVSTELR